MNTATRPTCVRILLVLLATVTPAAAQSTSLAFETDGLDLETGEVLPRHNPTVDFYVAANPDRATMAVIFQTSDAEIAVLLGTPFDLVDDSMVPTLTFSSDLVDEYCTSRDTVVIRTAGGSVYKIGNLIENAGTGVVTLDYEQLQRRPAVELPRALGPPPFLAAVDTSGQRLPAGLTPHTWRRIRRHIEQGHYAVKGTRGVLVGANPAQGYSTSFGPQGILVRSRGPGVEVGLTITGWGFGSTLLPVAAATPQVAGSRVQYVRGGLTEWYVNRPSGLEQGFTLTAPPDGAPADAMLLLELTLSGSVVAEINGDAIELRDAAGTTALRYGGLKAWDANGRALAAAMTLTENRVALEVDAAGAVYPVTIDPTIINEDAKVTAGDGAPGDLFGYAVAVAGDTVLIGAHQDDDAGSGSGSAYVFTGSGSHWTQQAKLTANDAAVVDGFGFSVAVSGDTAVVGAFGDDDAGSASGAAYVFTRSGTTWTQQAKLTASDAAASDNFGAAVAVAGETAVIGAFRHNGTGIDSGAAYIYTRSGSTWTEQAELTGSDGAPGDGFGFAVAVDGDTTVIGARTDQDAGISSGSAYVFTRSGNAWTEQAKLTASDAAASDVFGWAVSVAGDTAVIGAYGDDDAGSASGSAYIFTRSGTTWTEQAKLTASDAAAADYFGWAVAAAGNTVVVGARQDDDAGTSSGSAYVFMRSGTMWIEQAKLTASDAAAFDGLGVAVAVAADTVVVGASADDDAGSNSGSVYFVSVAPANTPPPTVDAGGPYAVTEGQSVDVTGTGSGPEGGALTYEWDLDDDGTYETPGQTATVAAVTRSAPESFTIRVRVTDDGGLTATDQTTVQVTYDFSGFTGAVDSPPTVNEFIAGRAVALRFDLAGDQGLDIFAAGYPTSEPISCHTSPILDPVEETITASWSQLTYKAETQAYAYAWKTEPEWVDTCRRLNIRFSDGTDHPVLFSFR